MRFTCMFLLFNYLEIESYFYREAPPTYLAIAEALGAYAYSPVVATGEFVKSIGESLVPAAKVLGSGAKKFVDDLGGVSKTVGNGFKDGAESVFKGIASGFESLGNKFTDLGKSIGSGATDLVNGLGDGSKDLVNGLGGGLTDLSGQLGGALDNLGSGLTDLGSHLVDGVKNIGSSVSHAFGRKYSSVYKTDFKKCLKIPKRFSEDGNRKTDNTTVKTKE